jgi:threonine-phosphate decarboxylase
MTLLRNLPEALVRAHPYSAAADVERSYAEYLGRPAAEFVAGRGVSEIIWTLAREMQGRKVGLPMPTYTEFRRAFAWANTYGGGPSTHTVEALDSAMKGSDVVILSNPHNPTGQVIGRQNLLDLASDYPSRTLIVDESYMDFLPDGSDTSLVGCEADNVVVLRSPSKFFGLAGIRSGVAWSRRSLRDELAAWRTPWPVSALAAEALSKALGDQSWARGVRGLLASDTAWLEDSLAQSGLGIAAGRLHFRLLTGSASCVAEFAGQLQSQGILVRVLEEGHGVGTPAVRISAPRQRDRGILATVLRRSALKPAVVV